MMLQISNDLKGHMILGTANAKKLMANYSNREKRLIINFWLFWRQFQTLSMFTTVAISINESVNHIPPINK